MAIKVFVKLIEKLVIKDQSLIKFLTVVNKEFNYHIYCLLI